jgi:putative flippase GtrA
MSHVIQESAPGGGAAPQRRTELVEIVIPVFNEQRVLADNVQRLHGYLADTVALGLTAIANTAANRRFTFGVRGPANALRHQIEGSAAFLISLALTNGALPAVHTASSRPSRAAELLTLVAANGAATIIRFLLLRNWVFHPRRIAEKSL